MLGSREMREKIEKLRERVDSIDARLLELAVKVDSVIASVNEVVKGLREDVRAILRASLEGMALFRAMNGLSRAAAECHRICREIDQSLDCVFVEFVEFSGQRMAIRDVSTRIYVPLVAFYTSCGLPVIRVEIVEGGKVSTCYALKKPSSHIVPLTELMCTGSDATPRVLVLEPDKVSELRIVPTPRSVLMAVLECRLRT